MKEPVYMALEEGGEWVPYDEGAYYHSLWFGDGEQWDEVNGMRPGKLLPVPTHDEMLAMRAQRAERPRVRVFTDVHEAAQ